MCMCVCVCGSFRRSVKCFDTIVNAQDQNLQPVNKDNIPLVKSLLKDVEPYLNKNRDVTELFRLLAGNPHVRALIEAHDTIAQQDYENDENLLDLLIKRQEGAIDDLEEETSPLPYYASPPIDAVRMIGVRKVNDEPLGNLNLNITRFLLPPPFSLCPHLFLKLCLA